MSSDVDVVISHETAKNSADALLDVFHAGWTEFRKVIDLTKSALIVFGQIHEDFGSTKIEDTLCINVAIPNNDSVLNNCQILINLIPASTHFMIPSVPHGESSNSQKRNSHENGDVVDDTLHLTSITAADTDEMF
jgi:hypothetical protein